MYRKIFMVVFCLTIILSVSCSGKKEITDDGRIILNYISTGAAYWDKYLPGIIEKYEKENTNVKINLQLYSHDQLFQNIEVKLGVKSDEVDIFAVDVPLAAAYAERGYLAPMTEYYTQEELDKMIPTTVESGIWDGVFYAPPMNTSSQALFYNTELLGLAGITIPENSLNEEDRFT